MNREMRRTLQQRINAFMFLLIPKMHIGNNVLVQIGCCLVIETLPFLHHHANHRHLNNKIDKISDGPGGYVTSPLINSSLVVDFLASLFYTEHSAVQYDTLFHGVSFPHISDDDQTWLVGPFTSHDIWTILKNMHPTKALGSDGYYIHISSKCTSKQ